MTSRVEFRTFMFSHESAQANLRVKRDGSAKLSNVYSQQRGQGHASELMQIIVDFADEWDLTLWLEVQRYGKPQDGLDNSQLIRLYEKFGFEILNDRKQPVMMSRKCSLERGNQ